MSFRESATTQQDQREKKERRPSLLYSTSSINIKQHTKLRHIEQKKKEKKNTAAKHTTQCCSGSGDHHNRLMGCRLQQQQQQQLLLLLQLLQQISRQTIPCCLFSVYFLALCVFLASPSCLLLRDIYCCCLALSGWRLRGPILTLLADGSSILHILAFLLHCSVSSFYRGFSCLLPPLALLVLLLLLTAVSSFFASPTALLSSLGAWSSLESC